MNSRNTSMIFVLAFFQWIVGLVFLFLTFRAAYVSISYPPEQALAAALFGLIAVCWLALSIIAFIIGWGLFSLYSWSRRATIDYGIGVIIVSIIAIITLNFWGVVGIILYAMIIYYLNLPEVVSIFSVQRPDHIMLYFDENFHRMMREWDLISRSKARDFKLTMLRRLGALSNDIDRIQTFRTKLEERLYYLDREMKKLERED